MAPPLALVSVTKWMAAVWDLNVVVLISGWLYDWPYLALVQLHLDNLEIIKHWCLDH